MTDASSKFASGMALRRDMFGPAGAEQAFSAASDFSKPLQELVNQDQCIKAK
jgi:hypothetical protein